MKKDDEGLIEVAIAKDSSSPLEIFDFIDVNKMNLSLRMEWFIKIHHLKLHIYVKKILPNKLSLRSYLHSVNDIINEKIFKFLIIKKEKNDFSELIYFI